MVLEPYFDAEAWAKSTATEEFYFDEREATIACEFFPPYLRHTKGEWAGKPFVLEDWQKSIIRATFGWRRNSDGSRRFRIVYIIVPRKNGKTQLAAGIALYLTFCDGEAGAEVYSVANDKEQAAICFNEAARMRKALPAMLERTLANKFSVFNIKKAQSYKVLSSDYGNKDGLNASGIIYDEFHAFKDRMLFDVMHTSTGSRRQPLEVIITTAGIDKHSVCYEQHKHAISVRDGILPDHEFLPVIFAADAEDDFTLEATWRKANPNLGKSIKLEYMQKEAAKAKQVPAYENAFKRLHLNIWTEQEKRWLPMTTWDRCGIDAKNYADVVATIRTMEESLKGRRCYAGLDLARVQDLSSLCLVFPPEETGEKWKFIWRFWCPKDNIAVRSRRDRVPYEVWERFGFIAPTPGSTTDFDFITAEILDLATDYDIKEIPYDRIFAGEIVNKLMGEGLTMVPFGQGFLSMASPTAEFERLVISEQIDHGGNPIARWNASNVTVSTDPAGNMKPDKQRSTERIDGIVAAIMGVGRASVHTDKEVKSIYETRGAIVL